MLALADLFAGAPKYSEIDFVFTIMNLRLQRRIQSALLQVTEQRQRVENLRQHLYESMSKCSKSDTRSALCRYLAAVTVQFALEEEAILPTIQALDLVDRSLFQKLDRTRNLVFDELSQLGEQFEALPSEDFSLRFEAFATMFSVCERDGRNMISAVKESHFPGLIGDA
jgi:hypothetical protein